MDVWSPELRSATWAVMSLLCAVSHEVTVRDSDLKLCEEDKRVCVTDLRDCGHRPLSSIQKTLNMSCHYQISYRSMTCEWSQESNRHTDSHVSLIFSSGDEVISCQGIFNPSAVLDVRARIKDFMMGREIWSQPHTVFLYDAVKPSQPVLTVLGSTEDAVVVSWRSSSDGSCRLRYRVNNTDTWTQALDSVPARRHETLAYTIRGLSPFTVYRAAVACGGGSSVWSDWSSDVSTRTLDRAPSRPPEVCYRVEKTSSGGSFLLHLMWKDLRDDGEHILGYHVSYTPVKKQQQPQGRIIQNVTEATALLVVEEGSCSVTVTAFNEAGYGPAARLGVDALRQNTLPSVRNLWVSSSFPAVKGLLVQWESPPSALPVSHFAVQWRSETRPSCSRWATVDGVATSAVIRDVDPDESYLISVSPVYNQQCGSPRSLPASLQQGALMEAVKLKVASVTKMTVTVEWAWQNKSGPIRVDRYRVMLRKDSERQTLSLWPDQWQHKLLDLEPNTEYSLLLLADNVSRNIIHVRTDFDEVPVVATASPLLLLLAVTGFISILSRTVYKSYFFPPISSPRGSTTGQWLMDPNHQKTAERSILDIEDFQVTDVLGENGLIVVGPNSQPSSEEDPHEDTSLLSISRLIIKLSAHELDTEYVSDAPVTTERRQRATSFHPDCTVNRRPPDSVVTSEESREAAAAPLRHQTRGADGWLPHKDDESRQVDFAETSHPKDTAVERCFSDFVANANSRTTCEAEYVVNSTFRGGTDVETASGQNGCSYLICETNYLANSCFTAKPADQDRTNNFSTAC